jgi:hypothetical protein
VDTALDVGDSPLGIGNWKEAVASTLPVPLVLVQGTGSDIRRVVLAHDGNNGVDPSASAFVAKLASTVARGEVLQVDASDPAWVDQLRSGDVAMLAVATFELVMGLPTPPQGAVVAAIPETTLPSSSLATVG